jgi:hypothetical protein
MLTIFLAEHILRTMANASLDEECLKVTMLLVGSEE